MQELLDSWKYRSLLIIIILISFFAYLPVLHNGILEWDDYGYLKNNPLIYSIDLKEIFSHQVMWNYHPLTILTFAIEYYFFGLNETGYQMSGLPNSLISQLTEFLPNLPTECPPAQLLH